MVILLHGPALLCCFSTQRRQINNQPLFRLARRRADLQDHALLVALVMFGFHPIFAYVLSDRRVLKSTFSPVVLSSALIVCHAGRSYRQRWREGQYGQQERRKTFNAASAVSARQRSPAHRAYGAILVWAKL